MPCPSMWPKQFWSVQNDFGPTKLIWSRPKWNGRDQNEMVTTKMNWSGPFVIHFCRKSPFGPDQFILVMTISFWSWPNHYSQVQINLVRPNQFWTKALVSDKVKSSLEDFFYLWYVRECQHDWSECNSALLYFTEDIRFSHIAPRPWGQSLYESTILIYLCTYY